MRHITSSGVLSRISRPPTLEQLFLRHYDEELVERDGAPVAVGARSPGGALLASLLVLLALLTGIAVVLGVLGLLAFHQPDLPH